MWRRKSRGIQSESGYTHSETAEGFLTHRNDNKYSVVENRHGLPQAVNYL